MTQELYENMSTHVTLTLSSDEALVLFEWLATADPRAGMGPQFDDPAEQRVLWNLHAQLERTLIEPFRSDYTQLLAAARVRVRDEPSS